MPREVAPFSRAAPCRRQVHSRTSWRTGPDPASRPRGSTIQSREIESEEGVMRVARSGGDRFGKSLRALIQAGFILFLSGLLVLPTGAASKKPSFREFVASLWPLAEERGVSRATFE